MSLYVKIYYGPNEEFFTLTHRPQKITGLKDHLLKLGFRVDTVPVEDVDYCMIEMCGHEVFRCNINHLSFNMPSGLDPVCQRAVAAIQDASTKLERANNYFWLQFLIQDLVFKRSELAPAEKWPFKNDLEPVKSCLQCEPCIREFMQ